MKKIIKNNLNKFLNQLLNWFYFLLSVFLLSSIWVYWYSQLSTVEQWQTLTADTLNWIINWINNDWVDNKNNQSISWIKTFNNEVNFNSNIILNKDNNSQILSYDLLRQLKKSTDKKCVKWDTWDWNSWLTFYSHPNAIDTYSNCEQVYLTDSTHLVYPRRWGIDIANQVNNWLWNADYIRTKVLYLGSCSSSYTSLCSQSYLSNDYVYWQNSVHENFAAWTKPKYSWGSIKRCSCDI